MFETRCPDNGHYGDRRLIGITFQNWINKELSVSEVSINDLKTKASEILRKVEIDKEPVTITRRGKGIARIVPMGEAASEKGEAGDMAAFGTLVGQMTEMFKGLGVEATIKTTTPDGKTQTKRRKA